MLLERLDYLGMSPFDKAIKSSPHAGVIRSILKGSSPTYANWERVCDFLGISIRYDDGTPIDTGSIELPIHGKIGAGGSFGFLPDDAVFDTIPAPSAYAGLIGLQVQGDSMYPVYN
ncbi:MAG: hypothetical protein K0U36_02855 [Alphaproteobacteria bacterium]|nr:hypothetical protein [Alphaproteobacteria bacterium]